MLRGRRKCLGEDGRHGDVVHPAAVLCRRLLPLLEAASVRGRLSEREAHDLCHDVRVAVQARQRGPALVDVPVVEGLVPAVPGDLVRQAPRDLAPTVHDAKKARQRGGLVVAVKARRNGDAHGLHKVTLTVEQRHRSQQAIDHGRDVAVTPALAGSRPATSVGVVEVLAPDVLPRDPPVVVSPTPGTHVEQPPPEGAVAGDEADGDVVERLDVLDKEGGADRCAIEPGRVRAPRRARDARAPLCPLHRLVDHAGVEGAPNLVDELGVYRPPPRVVLPGAGLGRQQALIHQLPRPPVRKPQGLRAADGDAHVPLPAAGNVRVGQVQAVLQDGVERHELDVRVVVCAGPLELTQPRGDGPPRVAVAAHARRIGTPLVVVGLRQEGHWFVHVDELEGQAHEVPHELAHPEALKLVAQLPLPNTRRQPCGSGAAANATATTEAGLAAGVLCPDSLQGGHN
mmetsp:Transcript_61025/g.189198  ORF Transcript_61025/g.189198 Transcript_61025/m.189198 type:complete len:456 (-) Transcript_61025:84-1451(-)